MADEPMGERTFGGSGKLPWFAKRMAERSPRATALLTSMHSGACGTSWSWVEAWLLQNVAVETPRTTIHRLQ